MCFLLSDWTKEDAPGLWSVPHRTAAQTDAVHSNVNYYYCLLYLIELELVFLWRIRSAVIRIYRSQDHSGETYFLHLSRLLLAGQ